VDYQNPSGDAVTFHLHSCTPGQHALGITYALAGDNPPRPLSVEVNGRMVEQGIAFPATGAWNEVKNWSSPFLLRCV
jgi:hypothetical protein